MKYINEENTCIRLQELLAELYKDLLLHTNKKKQSQYLKDEREEKEPTPNEAEAYTF